MSNSNDRFNGFLTKGDRKWLTTEGKDADSTSNKNRQKRHNIRQRAAKALEDFELMEEHLPMSDRHLIVSKYLTDTNENPEGRISSILAFLWTAFTEHYNPADWENWLERAIRKVEPVAHVDVSIRIFTDDGLDELEKRVAEDPSRISRREAKALFRTGRIEHQRYTEIVDTKPVITDETDGVVF